MMVDILTKLNQIGKNHIDQSFSLNQKKTYVYVSNGNNISEAINHKKGDRQQVKVLNWFNEFWLYINIKIIPSKIKKNKFSIQFSLSVFHGDRTDNNKIQLFRAEWDNYEELSDSHPQPHWHFYSHQDIEDQTKSFKEITDSSPDGFDEFIGSKSKIVNINRIHFAMNGQWANNNSHVHQIETANNLIDWFEGVLTHIKSELNYIEVK